MKVHSYKFFEYLKYERNYSNHTITSYRNDILSFEEFLKLESINNIKEVDYQLMRKYLIHMYDRKLSRNTISRNISTLKSFFKYLQMEGIIKDNPLTLISSPKEVKKLPNYLHQSELEELLSVPDSNTALGMRNILILELLYSTGVRVSELVNIKIKDINLYSSTILILGKGSKERYVVFGEVLKDVMSQYLSHSRLELLNGKDTEYLILNKYGDKITDRGIRSIIDGIVKRTTIHKNVSPHIIRHTFATHMLDGGADLKVVQELLGHDNLSTTQIYTHVSNNRLRDVYLKSHPSSKKEGSKNG